MLLEVSAAMRSLAVLVIAAIALAAPRVVDAQPSVAVMIASAGDSSPGALDADARGHHAEIVRRALRDVLRRSGAEVRLAGIGARHLDVAVVDWKITPGAGQTEVAVKLRVIVTDDHGRMLSILTGRAQISTPGKVAVAQLRDEAIAEAVKGMTAALQAQLARDVG